MKTARRYILLALLAAGPALAGGAAESFSTFRARFAAALSSGDAARVADLTRLPFLFEGEPRDRKAFMRLYPTLFTPDVTRCIATAKPVREEDGEVLFCPPYAFYFGREEGQWRLLEFSADGEEAEADGAEAER